jgi:tetratricopeptide (TPR) repeat protein
MKRRFTFGDRCRSSRRRWFFLVVEMILVASAPFVDAGWFSSRKSFTTRPELLKSGLGVRALGLGNAFVSLSDDASGLSWNPAGMDRLPQSEALFEHDAGADGESLNALLAVWPFWAGGRRHTWGVGAVVQSYGEFSVIEDGAAVGRARPWDGVVGLSYARRVGPCRAGVTGKWAAQRSYQRQADAPAMDVGFQSDLGDGSSALGVALANLGPPLRPGTIPLPWTLRLGFHRRLYRTWRSDGLLAVEEDLPRGERAHFHLGGEFGFTVSSRDRVSLRLGFRENGGSDDVSRLSVGAGWTRARLGLNYAFAPSSALGARHRFDAAWRFGAPLPSEVRQNELWRDARNAMSEARWAKARLALNELRTVSPHFGPARAAAREVDRRLADILDPETLYQIGHSYMQSGEDVKAEDFFSKLLIARPDHAEGRAALGVVQARLADDRRRKSQAADQKQRRADEDRRLRAIREFLREGRWEDALGAWGASVDESNPPHPELWDECRARVYDAAVLSEGRGDLETALRLFRRLGAYRDSAAHRAVLETAHGKILQERAESWYEKGLRAYAARNFQEARTCFTESLKAVPNNKVVLRALERLEVEERQRPRTPASPRP